MAHTDVVPVDGQSWSSDPFQMTERDGRLFGRGTCDMKGFLACMLGAADRASRMDLLEPLKLSISYDEEVGCVGISHMIDHLASTIGLPRVCIVGEPTELRLISGHKGKAIMQAVFEGMAGHSSMAPQFMNALHLASDLITRIRAQQEALKESGARDASYGVSYSTLHVGRMLGGTALNIVPKRATVDFELRHLAQDPPQRTLDALAEDAWTITEAARKTYPPLDIPPDADIIRWLSQAPYHSLMPAQKRYWSECRQHGRRVHR